MLPRMDLMPFVLLSPDFPPGAPIPREFTCDGSDISPPLDWTGAPPNTASFAILLEDPDAPGGTFRHWLGYGIGAVNGIPGGLSPASNFAPFNQARNDFGKIGYSGPCPPPGSAPHHYHFVLFALSQRVLDVQRTADIATVLNIAQPYAIARAELIGTYQR
jgi:Raf kinase inhibitor-like YbhB/YbcL family protein